MKKYSRLTMQEIDADETTACKIECLLPFAALSEASQSNRIGRCALSIPDFIHDP